MQQGSKIQQRSELAERVLKRLKELGISQSEAARRAGFNRAYLSDLLSGKKSNLHQNNYRRLAKAIEMELGFLLTGTPLGTGDAEKIPPSEATIQNDAQSDIPDEDLEALLSMQLPEQPARSAWAGADELRGRIRLKPVPVFRSAPGRLDGAVLISADALELAPRPPLAKISDDWYVVSLSDSSMSPRFEPGEFLYVRSEPKSGWKIRPRDYVVIQVEEKIGPRCLLLGYVRRFLREVEGALIVTRLHPIEEEIYDANKIVGLGHVLVTCEPYF